MGTDAMDEVRPQRFKEVEEYPHAETETKGVHESGL
jgi:hypothetical protein